MHVIEKKKTYHNKILKYIIFSGRFLVPTPTCLGKKNSIIIDQQSKPVHTPIYTWYKH